MKNLLIYGDASKNSFNDWLATSGLYIAFALAGVVFLVVLGLFLYTYIKEKKNGPVLKVGQPKEIKNDALLKALGDAGTGLTSTKVKRKNTTDIVVNVNHGVVSKGTLSDTME